MATNVTLINAFSGGAGGVTIVPGNSGNPSGTPWDATTLSPGATLAYDTTRAVPPGLVSCKIATTSSGQASLQWGASLLPGGATSQATVSFRGYFYFTANPAANTTVFRAAGAGNATCARISVSTAGQVVATGNAGTLFTVTSAIPLNQWFRLEAQVTGSASAGAVTVNRYDAYNSTLPSATGTASGVNTFGVMTTWRFGQDVSAANIGPYWMAGCALSNSGAPGPVPLGFTPTRIDGVGCVTQVAQNPAVPAQFVAGCDVGGFFLSPDYGAHWAPIDTALYQDDWRQVACVQWSAYEANTIYACVGNQSGGFMAYTLAGGSWSFRSQAFQYAGNHSGISGDQSRSTGNLLAQAGTPSAPLMYTATYDQGVYRSTSHPAYGSAWTNIGLSGGTFFGRSIAADPNTPGTVYVAMYGLGVYKATNANTAAPANWAALGNSLPHTEEIIALSVSGATVLYAACGGDGVWTSADNGATWQNLDPGGSNISTASYWITIDGYYNTVTGATVLVAGCNNAVQLGGDTAYRELAGIVIIGGISAFTQFTASAAAVGVATVPPESRTWWQAPGSGSQADTYHQYLGGAGSFQPKVLIDKTNLPASAAGIYRAGSTGFFASANSGATWQFYGNGLSFWPARMPQVDPSNTLHMTCTSNDYVSFDASDGSAYNAATMIQSIPSGAAGSSGSVQAIDPVTGAVYLATAKPKYTDTGGAIWARPPASFTYQDISLTGGQNPSGYVAYGLAAGRDSSNAPYLLAMVQKSSGGPATGAGMWKYSGYTISPSGVLSGGGSWSRVNSTIATTGGIPPGTRNEIIADPASGSNVYAFDQASGLWRSVNAGGSWTRIWAITSNVSTTGWLAVNPAVANELWLTYTGGIYKISGANTISSVSIGTNTTQVTAFPGTLPGGICFAPDGTVYCLAAGNAAQPAVQLYASVNGGASWYTADNGSIAAAASIPERLVYAPDGRLYVGTVGAKPVIYGYPLPPVDTGQALVTFTFSATATGTDTGGTTKHATANATFGFGATAAGSRTGQPLAQVAIAFSATTSGGAASVILQQVQGIATLDYGAAGVEITTAAGSFLVVLAGWDLSTAGTAAPMPAVYVTDSACNYWIHAGTTSSGVTGSRTAVWVCPNAMAIEWLSVALTTFASSLAFTVLELDGAVMPQFYSLDVSAVVASASSSALALMPGVTTDEDGDYAFAAFTTGGYTRAPVLSGNTSWSALTSVVAGSGPSDRNPVQLFPYFQAAGEGTSLATTFTLAQAVPVSGVIVAVHSTVYSPVQGNPNFPPLRIECGFGFTPGDPSSAPPVWTDITARVVAPLGQDWVNTGAGREYELATAEAGTMEILVDNHDSALLPGNQDSPFWPNVVLETPVRVSAFWQGQWFALATGYIERWPQAWPDLPQWGLSKMVATDTISVVAAVTMLSALDGDTLLDVPYLYLPANEQYLSFANGINGTGISGQSTTGVLGSYTPADAQGLPALNYSRVNQRAGVYTDGVGPVPGSSPPAPAAAETGQTTSLLGSAATGFGTSAFATTAPTAPVSGPGILYTDPNLPGPQSPGGVTVSFWLIISAAASFTSLQPVVFTAYGPPSSYLSAHASLSVQVQNFTGNNTLLITLADGSTLTAPFTVAAAAQMVTLTLTASSLSVYVNAALELTASLTAAQTTAWNAVSLGCPNYAYQAGGMVPGNFTAFGWAIYPYLLPQQRIVSQYATGTGGQQNVDAVTRVAQILAWAGLGIPHGGRVTFNGVTSGVTQGPAYSLAGATAADAVNQVAANENTMVAGMPDGSLVFIHEWALFNQSPVIVLGDAPLPAAGQVPSLQATSWDYDNTYLYNQVQVTRQYGANNLFTVAAADFASQHAYNARSALSATLTTMSNADATGLANWQLAKYSQPQLRVSGLTVDAASNPAGAFPAVLSLLQGQVATATRTPVGGATISENVLIQKISWAIGPGKFQLSLQLSPYSPEDAVLQLDAPAFNQLGNSTLA